MAWLLRAIQNDQNMQILSVFLFVSLVAFFSKAGGNAAFRWSLIFFWGPIILVIAVTCIVSQINVEYFYQNHLWLTEVLEGGRILVGRLFVFNAILLGIFSLLQVGGLGHYLKTHDHFWFVFFAVVTALFFAGIAISGPVMIG